MKYLLSLLPLLFACQPAANSRVLGECAQPSKSSLTVAVPNGTHDLLIGDSLLTVWEGEGPGGEFGLWCSGATEYTGEGFGIAAWLFDDLELDSLAMPFVGEFSLMLQRDGEFIELFLAHDTQGRDQPFFYVGPELVVMFQICVTECILVAVEEGDASWEGIYPNPTSGPVWLPGTTAFRVYDQSGRVVFGGAGGRADLSGLPRGTYIIQTRETSHLITLK